MFNEPDEPKKPSDIVQSFHRGHEQILGTVARLQPLTHAYLQAKPLLRDLQGELSSHFERQNNKMFDDLNIFLAEDRPGLKILEFLAHDLKDIKIKFLLFFDMHSGEMGDVSARNFPRDFREFSDEVIRRVHAEEEYLLPFLKRLMDSRKKLQP